MNIKYIIWLITFIIFSTTINYAQIDTLKIDVKSAKLIGEDQTYKQIEVTKQVCDSIFSRLIHGTTKLRFNLLLNKISKKYLILGIEFLDDSLNKIGTTSFVKYSDFLNDGYFDAESTKTFSKLIASVEIQAGSVDNNLNKNINDTLKIVKKDKLIPEKKAAEYREKSDNVQNDIIAGISYNYISEKLVGKFYTDGDSYTYQHSSWKKLKKAMTIVDKFKKKGVKAFYYPIEPKKGMGIWYRVRIGPYRNISKLDSLMELVKNYP